MNELANHWGPSLQALSYWIAYKQQYYRHHLLTEGAVVGELTQLISANIDSSLKLECESLYKQFDANFPDSKQCDLVIGKKTTRNSTKIKKRYPKLNSDEILEAIEVKRYEGDFKRISKDFEKIYDLRKANPKAQLFTLVVGQKQLPIEIFTDSYNVRKSNIYSGSMSFKAIPRLGKKAYATKKKSDLGIYSVLIEIDPA
jgi:hypothetical protein